MTERVDPDRRRAYVEAYELFEAVQVDGWEQAVAVLPERTRTARERGWTDVGLVLRATGSVSELVHSQDPVRTLATTEALVGEAEAAGLPALTAVALALRAVASSALGASGRLMDDASRAVALLDDESQPALDRCTGYVVAAAAYNTLRLWELVDELYAAASALEPECEVPAQSAAIAANRVLVRWEWAAALLENGDDEQARQRLALAGEAVQHATGQRLPDLWRRDVEACATAVRLLRGDGPSPSADAIESQRAELASGPDVEALPLFDASTALALWRDGQRDAAVRAVSRFAPTPSVSSGAKSFPLWVRGQVLGGADPGDDVLAQRDHALLLARLQWESRVAVLVAARASIAAERGAAERTRLSRAVNTDPLTGLDNRRIFDRWLERRGGPGVPTALLLVDLDDFKAINDTFGHGCGDEVLRRFGRLLLDSVRPGDLAVRHGGDEFAVLLQSERLTADVARLRAERLQELIAAQPWTDVEDGLAVTASIGLAVSPAASSSAHRPFEPDAVYRAADTALYEAKRERSGLVVAPTA